MLKLYTYFRSSSAYRVRIALNLKGLEHELIPVHLVKDGGEQRKSDFLEKNPIGQIPVLEHGDFRLSQSLPIMGYLEQLKADPALFSETPKLKYQQVELCEIVNSGIQPLQNLKMLQHLKSEFNVDQNAIKAWCKHWIENGFKALEKRLQNTAGTYSFGGSVTAVDCFLLPQVYNARRYEVDMKQFPIISRIETNCLDLKVFRDAHPDQQADAE